MTEHLRTLKKQMKNLRRSIKRTKQDLINLEISSKIDIFEFIINQRSVQILINSLKRQKRNLEILEDLIIKLSL